MRIGNPSTARQLLVAIRRHDPAAYGFEIVGQGSFRSVWRKGGVVYKHDYWAHEDKGNSAEYATACALKGKPGIPPVTLYQNGILAMPYYPRSINIYDRAAFQKAKTLARTMPFFDVRPNNMRADYDGNVWVVDLGQPITEDESNFPMYAWRE